MSLRVIGIAIGLVLGIVWAAFGFSAALLTGLLALVGWGIAAAIEKRINVTEVWGIFQERWH